MLIIFIIFPILDTNHVPFHVPRHITCHALWSPVTIRERMQKVIIIVPEVGSLPMAPYSKAIQLESSPIEFGENSKVYRGSIDSEWLVVMSVSSLFLPLQFTAISQDPSWRCSNFRFLDWLQEADVWLRICTWSYSGGCDEIPVNDGAERSHPCHSTLFATLSSWNFWNSRAYHQVRRRLYKHCSRSLPKGKPNSLAKEEI